MLFKKSSVIPSHSPPKDCIVCLLRPLVRFSCLIGLSPVEGYCHHSKPRHSKAKYVKSNFYLRVSTLIAITLIAVTICNIKLLTQISCKMSFLQLAAEILFCTNALVLMIPSMLQVNQRVKDLNGWNEIFENRIFFGLYTIFDEQVTRAMRRRCYFFCVIIVVVTVTYGAFKFTIYVPPGSTIVFLRRMASVISVYVQTVVIFEFSIQALILKNICQVCFRTMAKEVAFSQPQETSGKFDMVEEKIKFIRRFRAAVFFNIKHFNKFLNPTILLWFGQLIAILIINIYLLIHFGLDDDFSRDVVGLEVKTYSIIICFLYLLNTVQDMSKKGEDIMSFIFRFPLCKLTQGEGIQIEMLISTIAIQQPKLKASDVFTLGTSLIASIAGTVVTYVLVALQFRASWND